MISKIVFNIDNYKKCLLNTKSVYWNDFWRIMWLKIQLYVTGMKNVCYNVFKQKTIIYIVLILHNMTVLLP